MARSVLITGGGGFLGSRLAALIAAEPGAKVRVVDVAFPGVADPRIERITGDLTDPAVLARALTPDTTEVFHLAAVVSGGAEADFDLGYRVNLDGTRALLEACRKLPSPPKVVFASSVAVFGGALPDVLDDSTTPTPQTSYGIQKLMSEHLVADYTRKGFIDGRSLRLPTIVVRPGKPNLAASSFASSIIREPLAGVNVDCPVPDSTSVWILSPTRVVEAFVHARDLPASAWPSQRSVNLPGITLSVREMLAALGRVAGKDAESRVRFVDDARIQGIVKTWPTRFRTERALAMGFKADGNFDDVVRAHSTAA
ncbi:D-erythronate dehydrogenase [Usitatibacter palustris]|uniref:D-erythronate dehydrogenase n=1 Tax=Usitatibacter palustris TaxID=2732487 RepID=A0A6M4H8Z5_9PROT|nr:D-erythronate dehydrogenase [Usitatibacter palustris]QJR16050.1 D-erythronate dehydrogenase [Usitatibacter palustris]